MVNRANFADNMPSLFSPISQAVPYKSFVNHGFISSQGAFVASDYFANSGTLTEIPSGDITLNISGPAINTNGTLLAPNSPITINANSLFISNSVVASDRALTFNTSCFLSDGYAFGNQFGHVTNATLPNVVANGNQFTTRGGVQLLTKPATGDLLGTTITDISQDAPISFNVWAGEDRGFSPSGFAENAALGRLILSASPNHVFQFKGANNNNALYVDSIQFEGSSTNTDANGNYSSISIVPGMKIYYAQALVNGISVAEKLNGKNGGGFCWVSNYAGVYSSTNLSGTLYNKALVVSTHIDSDGDTIVNGNDATPIPAGTFDVANPGPIACGGGSNPPFQDPSTNSTTGGNSNHLPGTLAFPAQQQGGGSGGVSFSIAQGSYNGLFYETNGVKASSAGSFTVKLTGKGTFSGKLQLGTGTYSFSKAFDQSGNCTLLISGKKLAPLTLTLHLVNNNEIDGQVSGDGWTAQLVAFSTVNNASSFGTGKHSLVLSTDADNSTATTGDSSGNMTLAKNGNIQWSDLLPDGGKLNQKSVLSKDGVWPIYSSLYDGKGTLIGWLQLSNHTSEIGGSAVWLMPANQNALYPNGLTNSLNASGSAK